MAGLAFDLLDRHVVHGRADELAVVAADGSMTYARVLERSAAVAAGLRHLGVGADDRVAVLVPAGVLQTVVVCACLRLGAVPALEGPVRVEPGPEGALVHVEDESIELDVLRRAGASDPAEALSHDPEGLREAAERHFGAVVRTLLAGGTVT